jgi:hypothetical protein
LLTEWKTKKLYQYDAFKRKELVSQMANAWYQRRRGFDQLLRIWQTHPRQFLLDTMTVDHLDQVAAKEGYSCSTHVEIIFQQDPDRLKRN